MTVSSPVSPTCGRFASIDIGTNSVLLLVAESGHDGLCAVAERATITRLGFGVDRTGSLDGRAARRTLDCLRSYADEVSRLKASNLQVVGTSALRDVKGRDGFLDEAEKVLGVRPRVLSGTEEALLSFTGAVSGLILSDAVTVFDVGGGSTEVISGHVAADSVQISCAVSLNVGAVRLHERHVKHDPPLAEELLSVKQDVRALLPESKLYLYRDSLAVIGVAGTVTTLFAISRQMATYAGDCVHGGQLSREEICHWLQLFSHKSVAERRSIPGLETQRADVIGTGTLIVLEVLNWLGARNITVSDRGVRWGLIEQRFRNVVV